MDAAFMSYQEHESVIHALRSGTGGARVTKVRGGALGRDGKLAAAASELEAAGQV
jgi:hypothetical protein